MIFTEERIDEILNILARDGKVFVKQLSEQFNVTDDMIRKDLQKLHSTGKLQRTYGGAIAVARSTVDASPFSSRLIANLEQKRLIARAAYSLLNDSDTVFIDVSSSNYLLAELIAQHDRPLTIVTNMLSINELFINNVRSELFFIGGKYHKKIGATIGAETIVAASEYCFDSAFIGCCGVDVKTGGVYNFDPEEGRTKMAFMKAAKRNYLLAEQVKFQQDGPFRYASLSNFQGLITDAAPAATTLTRLKKLQLQLFY